MLRNDNRLAAALPELQDFRQHFNRVGVKIRGRFIENKQLRLHHRDACAGDLLLFAAREIEDIAVKQRFDVHITHGFVDSSADFILGESHILAAERQLAGRIYTEKLTARILEYTADFFGDLLKRCLADIHAADLCAACKRTLIVMRNQTVQQARDCCFAAAGFAAEQDAFTLRNMQADLMQRGFVAVLIMKAQILNLHHDTTPALFSISST